jgi:hypothetical protein
VSVDLLRLLAVIPEANDGGFNGIMFDFYLRTRILDIFGAQMTPEQYEQVFHAIRWYYVNWPYLDDEDANREAINKVNKLSIVVVMLCLMSRFNFQDPLQQF